jgi:hypothetical protein
VLELRSVEQGAFFTERGPNKVHSMAAAQLGMSAQMNVAATRSVCHAAPRLVSRLVPFTAAKPQLRRSSRSSTAVKVCSCSAP